MPVLDIPPPACMQDPEIELLADAAARFFEREATEAVIAELKET